MYICIEFNVQHLLWVTLCQSNVASWEIPAHKWRFERNNILTEIGGCLASHT